MADFNFNEFWGTGEKKHRFDFQEPVPAGSAPGKDLELEKVQMKNGRVLFKKMRCPFCSSANGSFIRTRGGFPVWKCRECRQSVEVEYI